MSGQRAAQRITRRVKKAHRLCLAGKSAPSVWAAFGEILTRCVTTKDYRYAKRKPKGPLEAAALSIA
jgi:hypothetical protein